MVMVKNELMTTAVGALVMVSGRPFRKGSMTML